MRDQTGIRDSVQQGRRGRCRYKGAVELYCRQELRRVLGLRLRLRLHLRLHLRVLLHICCKSSSELLRVHLPNLRLHLLRL